jgi:predicted nuclease of predicted toxin-antitoxin system
MRFLANENFPDPSIVLLRADGHDVRSIREDHSGISDQQVIAFAQIEDRIILTFDKDYGELIFKDGIENPPAVLFLRYRGRDPKAAATLITEALVAGTVIQGRFTVIEEEGIRQRIYQL